MMVQITPLRAKVIGRGTRPLQTGDLVQSDAGGAGHVARPARGKSNELVPHLAGGPEGGFFGDLGSSIEDTVFTVNASRVLDVTPQLAPNGKIRDVAGTRSKHA